MPDGIFDGIGTVTLNVYDSLRYIFKRRFNTGEVLEQIARIGFDSLPIALIINMISGAVLSINATEKFALSGANEYVGGIVALATIREMAPIFTALAVGARAGTAIAAEMANMAVTNQLDALQVMHVNPIRYLMVPRVVACVISLPLITILAELAALIAGMITAATNAHTIHPPMFLHSVWLWVKWYDIEVSMIKAAIFGLLLAAISVTIGINTKGGARNVGLSTTQSTVWIAITVIISDFFLTWMLFGTSFDATH